jgi:uncharacterized protein (TIGR00297 family)
MHDNRWRRFGAAAVLSGGLGAVARWRRALTTSGALGALLTGTSIAGAGGWDWGGALVYFFVSSSALSRVASRRKLAIAVDKFDKGSQRDLGQALANGGVASVLALARATPWGRAHDAALEAAFAGALAAATADTWATEVGTLSPWAPRLITTGRCVAAGTSGGITPLGLVAAAAGAATLGLAFAVLSPGQSPDAALITSHKFHAERGGRPLPRPFSREERGVRRRITTRGRRRLRAAALGGMAGALADSVLGATLQAMYRCPCCGVETERRQHRCGSSTVRVRGMPWVDNDVVNAACTLIGAAVGAIAGALAGRQ